MDSSGNRWCRATGDTLFPFGETGPVSKTDIHCRVVALATALAVHTGWPATTESLRQVTGPGGAPDVTVKPDLLYGSRLPDYYRLDMRITRRKQTRRGEWRFFLDVVNVTNHANVLGYDYFRSRDPAGGVRLERSPETWFTILPSLGVSWSGRF